jgi:hypothetical protein
MREHPQKSLLGQILRRNTKITWMTAVGALQIVYHQHGFAHTGPSPFVTANVIKNKRKEHQTQHEWNLGPPLLLASSSAKNTMHFDKRKELKTPQHFKKANNRPRNNKSAGVSSLCDS